MTLEEILEHEESFRYQMLGRMQQDCNYYIGCGGGTRLWASTPEEQIKYMKAIWKSFPTGGKPKWLRYKQILEYEKVMIEIKKQRGGRA